MERNTSTLRLIKILEDLYMTPAKLSIKLGLKSNTTLGRTIRLNRDISSNILTRLLITYPELNSEWLINGTGKMWKCSLLESRLTEEAVKDCKTLADRVNKILEVLDLNPSNFATIIGVYKTSTHDLVNGNIKNLSIPLLNKITDKFPELNKEWLLLGLGKPVIHSTNHSTE